MYGHIFIPLSMHDLLSSPLRVRSLAFLLWHSSAVVSAIANETFLYLLIAFLDNEIDDHHNADEDDDYCAEDDDHDVVGADDGLDADDDCDDGNEDDDVHVSCKLPM